MGAAVSCVQNNGNHLLAAAAMGDQGTVREVLEGRPQLAICALVNGHNCIAHQAASHGHLEVLRAMVETLQSSGGRGDGEGDLKGRAMVNWTRYIYDVLNARNAAGQTPLMLACMKGHSACVRFLLDHFADPFATDKATKRNALHYAAAAGRADAVRRLLADSTVVETEQGFTPLRLAMVHDMTGATRYVDSRGENGLTALHMAAIGGHLAVVQALLAAGASLMVRTVDLNMQSPIKVTAGSTPLHLAAQNGSISIVQAILQAHADAMGNLGHSERDAMTGRRAWENDGRIDLRSVTNVSRQLPYHVAYVRGFRECASILNPTRSIDWALESAREMDDGFGAQKLQVLAAYALRKSLLTWLSDFRAEKEQEAKKREEREKLRKAMLEHRRKEALKFHSSFSVDNYMNEFSSIAAVSRKDAGHMKVSLAEQESSSPSRGLGVVHELTPEASSALSGSTSAQPTAVPSGDAAQTGQDGVTDEAKAGMPERGLLRKASIVSPFASTADEPFSTPTNEERAGNHRESPTSPQVLPVRFSPASPEVLPARLSSVPSALPSMQPGPASVRFDVPDPVESAASTGAVPLPRMHSERLASRKSKGRRISVDYLHAQSSGHSLTSRWGSATLLSAISGFRLRSKSEGRTSLEGQRLSMLQLWQEATIPGFEDAAHEEDDGCGICLDAPTDIGIDGCKHRLCCDCSIQLCEVNKKPPLCPFCRNLVCGFHR